MLAASRRDLVTIGVPVLLFLLAPVNVITVAVGTPLLAAGLALVIATPAAASESADSPVPIAAAGAPA